MRWKTLTGWLSVQIREVINHQAIRVYQPPIEQDDEASAEHARLLMVRRRGLQLVHTRPETP